MNTDVVVINSKELNPELVEVYRKDNEYPIEDNLKDLGSLKVVRKDVLSSTVPHREEADQVKRSLIRHDPDKLARVLNSLISSK